MKKLLVVVALGVIASSAFSADGTHSPDDAKKQEMMKAFMQYSSPGAAHKALSTLVGNWKYDSRFWESPEAKPEVSKGTSTIKYILGGRFLQHETRGKAMGMPFEGLGFTGYDNLKQTYDTLWLDNMATGVIHGTGTFDEATHTLKDSGSYSCPMTSGKTRSYRSEWKIVDKNHHTYTMWDTADGKEFKQMEMAFERTR